MTRILRQRVSGYACLMLLLLCISVIVQMLGVPVTLLDPGVTSDPLGASVLEGFSVPPSAVQLSFSTDAVLIIEIHRLISRPVLASALFHPPLLSFLG